MRSQQGEIIDTGERRLPDSTQTFGAPMLIVDETDPGSVQRMGLIELSGALDFWDDPEEDIYSPGDGT